MSDVPYTPRPRRVVLPGRGPGSMAYLDFGDEDRPVDLVFLHANGFNALTYRRILSPLAERFRFLAIDQRGHGATDLETQVQGRGDWLDLRDDLLAFLAALNLQGVVLSGHSMGGTVSLLAADAAPERCRRLVLFDPVIIPAREEAESEPSPMVQAAERRRAVFPDREAAVRAYLGRGAFRTWPEATLRDYVAAGFHDLPSGEVTLACAPAWEASGYSAQGAQPLARAALARAARPADILRAETASTFYMADPEPLDSARIQIATVPGSTHFLPMERPDLIESAVSAALTSSR
jgi:pimeloyl-ACP methyl ester carboxylesterase